MDGEPADQEQRGVPVPCLGKNQAAPQTSRAARGKPEMGKPEMGKPEMGKPEMGTPEMGTPMAEVPLGRESAFAGFHDGVIQFGAPDPSPATAIRPASSCPY